MANPHSPFHVERFDISGKWGDIWGILAQLSFFRVMPPNNFWNFAMLVATKLDLPDHKTKISSPILTTLTPADPLQYQTDYLYL